MMLRASLGWPDNRLRFWKAARSRTTQDRLLELCLLGLVRLAKVHGRGDLPAFYIGLRADSPSNLRSRGRYGLAYDVRPRQLAGWRESCRCPRNNADRCATGISKHCANRSRRIR